MKRVCCLILFAIVTLPAAGCRAGSSDSSPSGADGAPPALDPQSIAHGAEIYAQHCAACHGAVLEGEPEWKMQNADGSFRSPPHNADGHTWHHGDAQLIDAVRRGGARLPADIGGTSAMPAYETILTEQEIVAVLDYIKNTWPEEQRLYQWERTLQNQP